MNSPEDLLLTFILGLIVGSFMNVCIYRLPRGLSLIWPGSICPHCRSSIKAVDNIPLLSFLLLRGRCRSCGARIDWRYPLVELLNGVLWLAVVTKYDITLSTLAFLFFVSSMIIVTFIDLEHMIIPDIITIPGTIAGIVLSPLIIDPFLRYKTLGIKISLAGAGTGFLLFFLIAHLGRWVFKKEAMGGGDIKLMAMIGAFTGIKGVFLTTFLGSLLGSIVGIILILKRRGSDTIIPFGPYLAGGAVISILFGEEIWRFYLG